MIHNHHFYYFILDFIIIFIFLVLFLFQTEQHCCGKLLGLSPVEYELVKKPNGSRNMNFKSELMLKGNLWLWKAQDGQNAEHHLKEKTKSKV